MNLCQCPRCGERSFEKLETYSHCSQCLYFEDSWESSENDYYQAEKILREFEDGALSAERQTRSNVIELPSSGAAKLETMGA